MSKLKILLKNSILKSKIIINRKKETKDNKKLNKNFQFNEILNISFEASDVIYMNKINIPPKKIKNNE